MLVLKKQLDELQLYNTNLLNEVNLANETSLKIRINENKNSSSLNV
jgi:hypothetical protein